MSNITGRPNTIDDKLITQLYKRTDGNASKILHILNTEMNMKVSRATIYNTLKRVKIEDKVKTEAHDWLKHMERKGLAMAKPYFANVRTIATTLNIAMDDVGLDQWLEFVDKKRAEAWTNSRFKHYRDAIIGFSKFKGVALTPQVQEQYWLTGKLREIGKYQLERISEDRWNPLIANAISHDWYDCAYVISMGQDTCARSGSIFGQTKQNFKVINGEYLASRYELKTKSTITSMVRPRTYELAMQALNDKPFRETEKEMTELRSRLKIVYAEENLLSDYGKQHAIHVLRHWGAHYWLEKTNYNFDIVAKIGGWSDPKMVRNVYGDVPPEIVKQVFTGVIHA